MSTLTPEALAELRERFAECDINDDGRIESGEFCTLLQGLDDELSEDECLLAFTATDIDEDGSIDFNEFVRWWTAN